MVKGVSRRVIVIKSPDKNIFEEAIFIVREDALRRGVTREELVREAQQVANEYLSSNRKKKTGRKIPGLVYALMGAGAFMIIYCVIQLL
ncbi:MAG: hypothetical protein E7456_01735 [Ruminococcaceae bacterium]|nr:hypothetical protein [Oscillospiraceae bacterium]